MVRICHFSDLHINGNHLSDFDQFIVKALIKDLNKFHEQRPIDLIILSGDLIDKGGDGFNNDLEMALLTFEEKFIDPIVSNLGLPKHRVFVCPGNHDIDRNADDIVEEKGLLYSLNSIEAVNEHIDSGKKIGTKRMIPFKNFEKSLYKDYPGESELTPYQSSFHVKLEGCTAGITCFNSVWRCFNPNNGTEKLILGERQITNARNIIQDCDLKIAVMHHSIDCLTEFDCKIVSPMLERDYDIVFCGHVHEGSAWTKTDMYGSLCVSVAPSNWTHNLRTSDRFSSNGYTIVDYDIDNMQIITHCRRYCHPKECFDPDTDQGNDQGTSTLQILDQGTSSVRQDELRLAKAVQEVHLTQINEHLLTNFADTKAPKDIESLFVLPEIVVKRDYDTANIETENEIKYNLDDLCKSNEQFIIFGTKESGKTTLLDRITIELSKAIRDYHKLPVFFDFDEVGNKDYETLVSMYLGVGITKISGFLAAQDVLLLIDNLSFENEYYHKLKRLKTFLLNYPRVRIIATSNQLTEGEIPLDFFEQADFTSFTIAYLKGFKTKQIKQLINNWFSSNPQFDTPAKLEKIVQILTTLNLPRTPLSISMFLWIIEQQENYKPINHATMLENFIEKLFRKWSKNEIYSEEFSFRNKERLLTEMAYVMYEGNDNNYRLKYTKAVEFISDYIRERKFEFDAIKILQYFLSKGILSSEYDENICYVRFRFTCFFQYYLMKTMEINPAFKEYVLNKENYLNFTDEIDYYTGIKRDQVDILNTLVHRMNDEYKGICDFISSLPYGYDTAFDRQASIAGRLDAGFVRSLAKSPKPDEDDFDHAKDEMLEAIRPEKGIEKKELNISQAVRLGRLWTLSAKVLKNTEETSLAEVKDDAYKSILTCSMAYANCYKAFLEDYFSKHKGVIKTDQREFLVFLREMLPLAHQIILHVIMGTGKLSVVLREKIESDINNETVSDFEKFLSVFLYADIRGKNYLKYIAKLCHHITRPYMHDMVLFKLVSYYFLRSKNKTSDIEYENLIGDVIIRAKKLSKVKKGKIIDDYRQRKKKIGHDKDTIDT